MLRYPDDAACMNRNDPAALMDVTVAWQSIAVTHKSREVPNAFVPDVVGEFLGSAADRRHVLAAIDICCFVP